MSTKGNRPLLTAARALCAAVVIIGISGCSLIPKEEEVLKPPLVTPQKETYDEAKVEKGTIVKSLRGTGIFESVASSYEEFAVTGKVTAINVRAGDKVKKGDVLMQLDTEGLELNVKEKERDLEQAKLDLDKAKETRDTQTMKVKLLQVEIAQTKLDDAKRQLTGKALITDMDGVATFVDSVKLGDTVSLNKTYVKIDDPNQLRLTYSTSNLNDMADVQPGMTADVTFKNQKYVGKVVQTPASAPQTENKTLADKYAKTLYLTLDKNPPQVEIGNTADIVIVVQKKDNVLKIPTQYVGSYLGRNFVKVREGESIKEVDIEKGLESVSPAEVEIVKGLKEGQIVIVQQ